MLFPRRKHPGYAICPFEILLKVKQVQWRRMNTIRIFNNTAMLAGEVAIVDDCRYLVFMIQRDKLISTYLILGELFKFCFILQEYFNLIYLSFYEIIFICQILFL
jgi:hypothetical protein